MECKEIVDLLTEYIDGELSETERRVVDGHLKDCPECRAQFTAIKSAVSMVKGIDTLEVPAELSRALRQIAQDASKAARPASQRRGFTLPKLQYLVASTAVAAVALIVLLTQIDFGSLEKNAAMDRAAQKSMAPAVRQQLPTANQTFEDAGHDVDSAGSRAQDSVNGSTTYGNATAKSAPENDKLPSRSLPGTTNGDWPKVVVSNKAYSAESASDLLDDIRKKTDGLYTVKDAQAKRSAVMSTLLKRITASGGKGEMLRSPINSLLDETKRAALPVYLERAKFDKQECMLIIIRWGFGGDKNSLYKASLYVTDLSGWSIIHYE
ncbi:MAG: anti-sigma factor family protein, partial [Candidatus Aquicultor sp.]